MEFSMYVKEVYEDGKANYDVKINNENANLVQIYTALGKILSEGLFEILDKNEMKFKGIMKLHTENAIKNMTIK